MALDAASLEAIAQEIRTCFLSEDAPDHLAILEQGIRQLSTATNLTVEYNPLMRAAHSLKGGSGIAQFPILSRLAHKLEDLLQALQQERVPERESAYQLLSLSVEQISSFIATASSDRAGIVDSPQEEALLLPTIADLEEFLQNLPEESLGDKGAGEQASRRAAEVEEAEKGEEAEEAEGEVSIQNPKSKIQNPSDFRLPQSDIRSLNLRMPVTRLDRINNTIGELFVNYERLSLYQEQLYQVDRTLKQRAAQLHPLNEQVHDLYENARPDTSKLQGTLQNLQELMVQVQEARADVELISLEFRETLVELRQHLDGLRQDVTQSRLMEFGVLARQFEVTQQNFSQRYNKSVQLAIAGKETPIDQVILEQLKIPLLHLARNAFDHGIETPEERQQQGKLPTARIELTAAVEGNSIIVTLADDGRGIDLQAVYQRAVEMGLCRVAIADLTKEQILDFLFQPGFSTATTVTSLSGRGLGLNIVRVQVERLRGWVKVETEQGRGTKFKIRIPLTLNILPLLLCKCQQRTWAIGAAKVKEVIPLSNYRQPLLHASSITWRDRPATLYSLLHLMPYNQLVAVAPSIQLNQYLGVVLEVEQQVVVLAVDSLLGERELVVKPFDLTVKVPEYILGCTVLGTGEVVPVLSPDRLGDLIAQVKNDAKMPRQSGTQLQPYPEKTARILIVDDAIAFRRILDRLLTGAGYQVVECRDGKEALEKLNSPGELFDLAISDIEMPQIDGLALLKEIRSHPQWHHLPVVMLTSRENQWHRQTASSLGATGYLTKPFQADDLLEAIANLLPATTS